MDLKYSIKKKLAVYCAEHGLQKLDVIAQISQALDVDQRTIYNYMAIKSDDEKELDDKTLETIARILETELSELVIHNLS